MRASTRRARESREAAQLARCPPGECELSYACQAGNRRGRAGQASGVVGAASRPRGEGESAVRRLIAAVALLGCASQGDPPGGPPDAVPPVLVGIVPERSEERRVGQDRSSRWLRD